LPSQGIFAITWFLVRNFASWKQNKNLHKGIRKQWWLVPHFSDFKDIFFKSTHSDLVVQVYTHSFRIIDENTGVMIPHEPRHHLEQR
jgi:hypothetical protein